jgi:hypothetical protein
VGPVVNFNHGIILTGNQNIAVLKPKKLFFNYEDKNIHFEPYPQISLRNQKVEPWVLHCLNTEFGMEPFHPESPSFSMFGMLTPIPMGFQRFKFNNEDMLTIGGGEGFDGDGTRYPLG